MIKTNDVLTATAVVVEKIPAQFKLSDNVNPIITGLNTACVSASGYNLDNIAVQLPEHTKEKSEHTELVDTTVTQVSAAIRDSLGLIRTHVIPACDNIENKIKNIGKTDSIIEMILSKLVIRFNYIPTDFFASPVFPNQYDENYQRGMKFTTSNLKMLGNWPEKTYEEIRAYISAVGSYPELHFALGDKHAMEGAWKTLSGDNYWLHLTGESVDPTTIDITPNKVKTLVALSLIVNKLVTDDDPYPGVTNIGLDEYRLKLRRVKGFLNTLLYLTKRRYTNSMPNGLMLEERDIKLERCEEKDSPFYGGMVLSGYVNVTYEDTISNFFSNSDDYSLSAIIVGMLYARANKILLTGANLIERLPDYKKAEEDYVKSIKPYVLKNTRIGAGAKLKEAFFELADGQWKEVLININGGDSRNLPYVLEKCVTERSTDIIAYLTSPGVVNRIRDGKLRVANTPIAAVFASVLGSPIAAEILRDNISEEEIPPERQRKILGKAVADCVIRRLLKPM